MSVEQTQVIDVVYIDNRAREVVLAITDDLSWDEAEVQHLLLLQEKLNTYLRFAESGEMWRRHPNSAGRRIRICVIAKHALSLGAQRFYDRAAATMGSSGISLRVKCLDEKQWSDGAVSPLGWAAHGAQLW